MRCDNNINNNRCTRLADKIATIKDITDIKQQSRLWICDECFYEKMYSDQLFKEYLIQVTELNNNNKRNKFQS
ncbi:MAG: hypothetical protein K0S93_844 [Nitrososphaeraceae archaeon]|jgi:hypothetical protein|nr:hypothetical protein [Nitrososphaeraceae archaeon]